MATNSGGVSGSSWVGKFSDGCAGSDCTSPRSPRMRLVNLVSNSRGYAYDQRSSAAKSRSAGAYHPARRLSTASFGREKGRKGSRNSSAPPNSESAGQESVSRVEEESIAGPSRQSHMDFLERLTSESNLSTAGIRKTIAQQLAEDREAEEAEEVTVPLGSGKVEMEPLTISQKRNIRRQNYLNEVSKRNDAPFFTAVALFVVLPPAAILGVAVATGYIDLFP